MTEDERLAVLYGDAAYAPAERIPLRAGPLSLIYEGGDLKYIRYGDREIIRRIYAAVRDENWGTIPATLTLVEQQIGPGSFKIVYDARHTDAAKGIDFSWRATLTGDLTGEISFDLDGEAAAPFQSRRTGICVLHPMQANRGQPVTVRHTDGSDEAGAFPTFINPHQPFFNIATITEDIETDAYVTIAFIGEVFEMEDQRNWMDASFKTYSRPQEWPQPYTIPPGERVHQTIRLTLKGTIDAQPDDSDVRPVRVFPGTTEGNAEASIGLLWNPETGAAFDAAWDRVQELELGHVRTHLDLAQDGWQNILGEADELASDLGVELLVGLQNPDRLPDEMPETEGDALFLLLPASTQTVEKAIEILPEESGLGGGYPVNFTELNRNRPTGLDLDYLTWAGTPQVHSTDASSIMETPPTIVEQIATALSFAREDQGLAVGPLTIVRPNRPADPRETGLMGAAWYIATLGYALSASPQVEYVTLCELFGPRGIVDTDGTPFPLFHALRDIPAPPYRACDVSDPLRVAAFLGEAGTEAMVINLTRVPQKVVLDVLQGGGPAANLTARLLDETNARAGFSEPVRVVDQTLTLPAYAIAHLVLANP